MESSPNILRSILVMLMILSAIPTSDARARPANTNVLSRSEVSSYASSTLASTATSPVTPPGLCANFHDVDAHYYACHALDYMVTKGFVNGYGDPECSNNGVQPPCFLPYSDVTRGEFSKILVNTYQWPIDTSGGPHFSDVPIVYVFYNFIETAYNRGIISGYVNPQCADNGVAAPCFLPGNNITRGQMSKLVSNASEYSDNTSGRTPSYFDVPTIDTFFTYIERLVMHAVNAQYPPHAPKAPICGSTAEPCFFPYENAPRIDAVMHIYLGSGHIRNDGNSQVFASAGGPDPTYDGIWVYMTTPDPTLHNGQDIGGPVAVTSRYNSHYIESGPEKRCNIFCFIHPYGTWSTDDASDYLWETSIDLGGGLTYAYKSLYFGGTGGQWQTQFCSTGCRGLLTSQDLGTALPFVLAGGESTNSPYAGKECDRLKE